MKWSRRVAIALGMATVAACGLTALTRARANPAESLGGRNFWALSLELAAGLGISSVGAYLAWLRRLTSWGALALATGLAVFLQELPLPGNAGRVWFTAGLVGGSMTGVLAGATAVAVSRPARDRLGGRAVAVALVATALMLGLGPALVFNPTQNGCYQCATNLVLVHGDPTLYNALIHVGIPVAALACSSLGILALSRLSRLDALAREPNVSLQLGAGAAAILGAALLAYDTKESTIVIDSTTRATLAGPMCSPLRHQPRLRTFCSAYEVFGRAGRIDGPQGSTIPAEPSTSAGSDIGRPVPRGRVRPPRRWAHLRGR